MSERHLGPAPGSRRPATSGGAVVTRVRVMGTSRWRVPLGRQGAPRLIAVGAASPGMGTSVVASNLAVAMAGLGAQVILVDLDLGAPGLETMFGIARPLRGIQAWLDGKVGSLDAALIATGIRNLHLVTGVAQPLEQPMDLARKRTLLGQLHLLDSDVVLVDVGASNRDDLLELSSSGALALLVCRPDAGALVSAFGFLEGAAQRASRRYGKHAPQALAQFRGRLIGNQTRTPEEAESFHAFSRLIDDHLSLPLPVLACIGASDRVAEAIAARRPLVARRGVDDNVRAFHQMAELLAVENTASGGTCDLGGETPIAVAVDGQLPVDLDRYVRRHTRHPVDWAGRLELAGRTTDVRVRDVSWSGAALDAFTGVKAGDRGLLLLHQLPGQPSLPVVIRHVVAGMRRVGVSFLEPGATSSQLVAAAQAGAVPAAQAGAARA